MPFCCLKVPGVKLRHSFCDSSFRRTGDRAWFATSSRQKRYLLQQLRSSRKTSESSSDLMFPLAQVETDKTIDILPRLLPRNVQPSPRPPSIAKHVLQVMYLREHLCRCSKALISRSSCSVLSSNARLLLACAWALRPQLKRHVSQECTNRCWCPIKVYLYIWSPSWTRLPVPLKSYTAAEKSCT